MLVDIHTHSYKKTSQYLLQLIDGKQSLGIHPWELVTPFNECWCQEKMQQLKARFNVKVLVIGECGLDRRRTGLASIEEQKKIVEWHLDWALETKRPIVLHCVRAYADLLEILKKKKYKGKILLHDYAGSLDMAHAFLAYDCTFSFGKRLLDERSKIAAVLQNLPTNSIFLETDDSSDIKIEEIYTKACLLLGIEQVQLEKIIEQNLAHLFANLDNVSSADVIDNLSNTV